MSPPGRSVPQAIKSDRSKPDTPDTIKTSETAEKESDQDAQSQATAILFSQPALSNLL
jgi:hypothetical protein